ncbi:MAG TPA: ATP-dependent Clp protease proteolytic subunit [Stellaceae bacterium]|jgi:ATP-dependent Clp protease protease subunit
MADLAGKKVAYYGFTGPIEPGGVTRLCQALNIAANQNYDQIYLCLSSQGGYVGDGIYLYNHIRALPVEVIAHATGSVASIAMICFVAAHTRYCSAHAMFMMHPTSVGPFTDRVVWERLQSALDSAVADDARTENILRERTKLSDEMLSAKRVGDVHLTPKQALEFGLVQDIREFSVPPGNQLVQI